MTDDEVIKTAISLCDRGSRLPDSESIDRPRLRTVIALEDELQARYLVPALVELIERRGLRAAPASWESIPMPDGQPDVRRLRVPGGWLYQVQIGAAETRHLSRDHEIYIERNDETWHPPVFVPEDARLARDERDLAVRQLRTRTDELTRCREGAESLSRDLVQRNQELGRLRDQGESRLDKLEARIEAIGGRLAGQDRTEGVIDGAGVWHDLPDAENEVDAIEAIVARLEAAGAVARIMQRVDDYGAACAAAAIATNTLPPRGKTEADVEAEESVARRAVLAALELAVPR
jgi:hypothetical protein